MNETYIHPMAIVETQDIGRGTRVWAFTHVMPGASIGLNCNIGEHCFIESGARVGSDVTIKNGNMLWEGVVVEDGAFIGPNVSFTNDLYPRSPRLPQAHERYSDDRWLVPTRVMNGASLGAGAVILAGVTIGAYALVGAGAVVTRDVPPHVRAAGNPAEPRGWVCECGQPLQFQGYMSQCDECGRTYTQRDETVRRAEPASPVRPRATAPPDAAKAAHGG